MATFSHNLSLFSVSILFLLTVGNSLNFTINRFDNLTKVEYEGDAIPSLGFIELTKVNYQSRIGRVTYSKKFRIWDSKTRTSADFSTRFSFIIDTLGRPAYGHGIAFFLSPVNFDTPLNSAGGFLGLFNTSTYDSISNQIVTIEFDSFSNEEWDPPYEHVGININSIASAVTTPWNASLHSGSIVDARIAYNSSTKSLTISWYYQTGPNFPKNSSLSYQIDLMNILPEWVKIGFSSSTGQNAERHQLQSWEFYSSLDNKETTSGNITKQVRLIIILGVSILLGAVFMFGFVLVSISLLKSRRSAMLNLSDNLTSMNSDLERAAGPRKLSYKNLSMATDNFSEERKLGEGGFGCVYKGYLKDVDLTIAVKKISKGSKQGKKEYITEVKTFSQLRHRNLVQLLGWCHDQEQFLLVYEYMPNGSLDYHIFGKKTPLAWPERYKVTRGLASALLYLHEEWDQCVVHRDIKSSNVMLDSSFNVKLGDFGLARLVDHELGPQTTGLAGTIGYLAPEYISTGRASKETDIYSFGVLILEIVTGRRTNDPMVGYLGLVQWVWDLYGKRDILSSVDERLHGNFDLEEVECLLMVGLSCAHPDRDLRPSIRQVIQVIHFEATLPDLPIKMPIAIYHVPCISCSIVDPLSSCSVLDVGR